MTNRTNRSNRQHFVHFSLIKWSFSDRQQIERCFVGWTLCDSIGHECQNVLVTYCIEDGSEQAEWLSATVLRLAEDVTVGADPEYIIKYDIDEDDDEWTMPLLKDLDKGDLILLN